MTEFTSKPWARLLLVILLAVLWFGTLGYRKVINPDEGRYSEIAREMTVSGDWVTPRLNGIKYFEKPALQYWATAASFEVLGESEFAARIWPGLTGFLGILFTFYVSRRLWGERTAWYAAAMLASCAWWLGNGHFLTLDMGVSYFMTLGMGAFVLAQRDSATAKETRNWMLTCWAAMGLAILSKGLIGLVLPGAVLVLYSIIQRDARMWLKLHIVKGLLLMLLITVPWFFLVSRANSEFLWFFFVHEHFQRFTTTEHNRVGPLWYFIPILIAGMIPWTSFLPQALKTGWQKETSQRFQTNRFLLIWAVFIFAFFSKSDSKLPSYILPIFPALAMLAAQVLDRVSAKALRWHLGWLVIAGIALIIGAQIFGMHGNDRTPVAINHAYSLWLTAAGVVLTAAGIAAWVFASKGCKSAAIASAVIGGLIGCQLPMVGHESFAATNSSYYLVQAMQPRITPQTTLYSVDYYDQTLPFYLKRTLQFVDYVDEFKLGQTSEPDKLIHLDEFMRRWQTDAAPMAVMAKGTYDKLQKLGLPMTVVTSDPRRIVIAKP
ncbi:glycosyltransferase family 39 protein [Silvimonas soli]|uniref:glycosyltransferase family 39 protein n=1 Tax=Silvimonas soli TaxID=2980100 RepID=UPI0024B334BA|nr:glycosyltransferase family 39 protein [Silvimonas soli]